MKRGMLQIGLGSVAVLLGIVSLGALSTTDYWRVEESVQRYFPSAVQFGSTVTFDGAVTYEGAQTFEGAINIDDGSGASPSVTFTDGSDETAVFSKADGADLSVTIGTTDSLSVLTGNLRVGNGSPSVTMDGEDTYLEGTLEVDGAGRFDGAMTFNSSSTFNSGVVFGANAMELLTATAVEITSPAVTFSVANAKRITLTSDQNVTGVTCTGGTTNQIVHIVSGAGSNTIRFDDAATMIIGAHTTLTEGQSDVLTLLCTSGAGNTFVALSAHDN